MNPLPHSLSESGPQNPRPDPSPHASVVGIGPALDLSNFIGELVVFERSWADVDLARARAVEAGLEHRLIIHHIDAKRWLLNRGQCAADGFKKAS